QTLLFQTRETRRIDEENRGWVESSCPVFVSLEQIRPQIRILPGPLEQERTHVFPRHERRDRVRSVRRRSIGGFKHYCRLGQAIDLRSGLSLVAVSAYVVSAERVDVNQKNISP